MGCTATASFGTSRPGFLKRPVERELVLQLLRPRNWVRLASLYFNRSQLAAEYYDEHLFNGATFADLEHRNGPEILINATDLSTGGRFAFNRFYFDPICSDLSALSSRPGGDRLVGGAGPADAGDAREPCRQLWIPGPDVADRDGRRHRCGGAATGHRAQSGLLSGPDAAALHPSDGRRHFGQPRAAGAVRACPAGRRDRECPARDREHGRPRHRGDQRERPDGASLPLGPRECQPVSARGPGRGHQRADQSVQLRDRGAAASGVRSVDAESCPPKAIRFDFTSSA